MTVVGRLPWSSNLTFLVSLDDDGTGPAAGRLQAGQRRAVAVGLPRRAVPPGGGGLRPVRGAGMGAGPADREREDGPFGPGSLQLFVEADYEEHYFTAAGAGRPRAGPAGHVRLRRRGQQRRPQERPRAGGIGRAAVGHRPRALLPPPAQAPHGHLGLRRRGGPGRRAGRRGPAGLRRSPTSWHGCCRRPECQAIVDRARHLVASGVFPEPIGDRPPYPWPLV